MVPIIALVGRPSVGKSTLFNRLTRTHDALVADYHGVTRDRKYGYAEWKGNKFIVIDTGGIDGLEQELKTHVINQSLIAIKESNIVLFMVDGCTGIMLADKYIAEHLKKLNKNVIIVVNKVDGTDYESTIWDFCSLGIGTKNIISIAALFNRGISALLELVLSPFVNSLPDRTSQDSNKLIVCSSYEENQDLKTTDEFCDPQSISLKIAVIGRPNVGKSTLINRMFGKDRMIVYDIPGTTRDSIHIPMVLGERSYTLIDTAGMRKFSKIADGIERLSVTKTLQAIKESNVVLLVVDAEEIMSDQDFSLLRFIIKSGRSLVIVINKWDCLSSEMRIEAKKTLDKYRCFIGFSRLHFISALHGIGISDLFDSINEAYQCSIKNLSTARLTRIVRMAVKEHQPPRFRGRLIKLKYAHIGGYHPPVVVIHGSQVERLSNTYKRYLMNYFCRSLGVIGTTVRIRLKENANPFSDKKNKFISNKIKKYNGSTSHAKKNKSA